MNRIGRVTTIGLRLISVLLSLLIFELLAVTPAVAGLGFTGNFYRQEYKLAPGENSEGIEAFVLIINTDTAPVRVEVKTEGPEGVILEIPENDFVLAANDQKQLDVVVRVNREAKPGEYTLKIIATSYSSGLGVSIAGGGSQQAKLKIVPKSSNTMLIIGAAIAGLVLVAAFLILSKRKRVLIKPRKA